MNFIYRIGEQLFAPFSNVLFLILFIFLLKSISKLKPFKQFLITSASMLSYLILYRLLTKNYPDLALFLSRLENPFISGFIFLVLPLIWIKGNLKKLFYISPVLLIFLAIGEVFYQYKRVPVETEFSFFLMRPGFLIGAIVSIIILFPPLFSVIWRLLYRHVSGKPESNTHSAEKPNITETHAMRLYRKVSRLVFLVLLLYGGFLFRQSYFDYKEMRNRRQDTQTNIMNLQETTPVLKEQDKLTYLPSAPCRFAADGGYVQGCPMELLQRSLQVNYGNVAKGLPTDTAIFAMILGALVVIIGMGLIFGRFFCGWLCPLSTLGDIFNFCRTRLGLPHIKPSRKLKLSYLYGGLGFGTLGLLLAKGYAHIDAQGKFMGCKIPVFPFCKLCPAQQLCPVASEGISAYPPLPGFEWMWGLFRYGSLLLLAIFLFGFLSARRLWCRFCPMGLIGGIFNRGSLMAIEKNAQKCNKCGVCKEVCPLDIDYVQKEMEKTNVTTYECVYCGQCVAKCPQKECLSFTFADKKIIKSQYEEN